MSFKQVCYFRVFQPLKVELESSAVTPHVLLQFQLHRHHDQVVVTIDICTRKCSALGSVDAGLKSPWCENIVDLVVCDAIGRMPRC